MSKVPAKGVGVAVPDTLKRDIEVALSDIEYAYESRSVPAMKDLLDNDFEGRLEFIDSLQSYFLSVKEIQIHFVIDTLTSEKEKVSARLHWFKKTVDNSGVFGKKEGSAQLVFRNNPEGLKLLYIRQDNPFF